METFESRMLLVRDAAGSEFTVVEHERASVGGGGGFLGFEFETYWVRDGRELTELEMNELQVIRELPSSLR